MRDTKLIYVDKLPPRRKCEGHRLQDMFEEFVRSGKKIARVDLSVMGYKTPKVACSCIAAGARRGKWLVNVCQRGDEIYLVKKEV